ncbi:MAG: amidohydrolase family protein [Candidatus Heimdallarchaeaceae archaeon]|jgi:predicted TIM-barrel fold metal-dependent hydrolase
MNIIDFHTHIYDFKDVEESKNKLLISMKDSGVKKSVLLPIAFKGNMDNTRKQNDIFSSLCKDDERLLGYGSVNPNDGDESLEEMERCVKELNLKGFKFHPLMQEFYSDDENFIKIMKKAVDLNVPILLDTYNALTDDQPSRILKAIEQSSQTKILLAHVGLFRFMDFNLYGFLRKYQPILVKNVYFDLTSTCLYFFNSPFQDQFRWVTEKIGEDRLIFGSDHPGNTQKESIEVVMKFGYPENWLPMIFSENAKNLLKI